MADAEAVAAAEAGTETNGTGVAMVLTAMPEEENGVSGVEADKVGGGGSSQAKPGRADI